MTRLPIDRCKVPQAFWRAVERAGISPAALLRQARLPATLHISEDAWVNTAQYFELWQALEELSGDPAIGLHINVAADTSVHPPATMSAFFAKDFRDGLNRLARFKRLCTPEELHVIERDGEAFVSFDWIHAVGPEPDVAVDVTFAAILELGRRGTGRHIVPLRVDMTRKGPTTRAHKEYLGAPITFGAPKNQLVLRADDLDRPFAGHNPELLAILTPALLASLDEIDAQSSLPEQVKIVLKRRLASGKPELSDVANALGMGERTLQRRISESGTSFRLLLEASRQELGREMLASGANAADEIAYLLGYQDTSSFYRAFREWEGVTPAQWREQNIEAPRLN
ncbi:AraC family transcriptional regulator [Mesorhizobium amorphae]|uniref:AraC family transcriptional regulator n=1 Tax=Mesorhizobium amorphae TaxID=71433 RepID=UPI003ECFFE18